MNDLRVYIVGMGLISSAGQGLLTTKNFIKKGEKGIIPLRLFPSAPNKPLPVGEICELPAKGDVPRTHQLAIIAANEAMTNIDEKPDAVVLGTTTGGIFTTEAHLKSKNRNPESYKYHSIGSVAEYIARKFKCLGPVITISTACSSGTVAIKVALEMLRSGQAKRVLAGGADSLCYITYYGFKSLQIIDPEYAKPFDVNRNGMSVAEGAAMLFLIGDENAPKNAIAEIAGGGLSCDAYHPVAPHPEGKGALKAMLSAILDANISASDIDYINLHGTGTIDNDLSEAEALTALFIDKMPPISSVKGAFGHSLAASGAIEAVVSAISISDGLIPANVGCKLCDPDLNLNPVMEPMITKVHTVLSNSFGFGGNNASLIIGSCERESRSLHFKKASSLSVVGSACITGAGNLEQTVDALSKGKNCKGMLSITKISQNLPPKTIRRLKRLPQLTLCLADSAYKNSNLTNTPSSIFFGTGWGALSETYDFLSMLFESNEQFSSPTDFTGSVHNAPAGQVAIHFKSTGPNITTSGGDYSFEQSLIVANLISSDIDDTMLVIGADESHEVLSGLFDKSTRLDETASDGGGGLYLKRTEIDSGVKIFPAFFENTYENPSVISSLIRSLGGPDKINDDYGAIFAGIPAAYREKGAKQLDEFLALSGFKRLVIDYRRFMGEFASASAVATVLAVQFAQNGEIPGGLIGDKTFNLDEKDILIAGLGNFITAIQVLLKKKW